MKTIKAWAKNRVVQLVFLLCFLIVDLVILGHAVELSKSDWATWVGSIGTVATLLGTIWLATETERRRRREQLDIAIIAAAYMSTSIQEFRAGVSVVGQGLPANPNAPDDTRTALLNCIQAIEDAGMWTKEDLQPLVVLPGHAAARLARISVHIRSVLATLKQSSKKDSWTIDEMNSIHGGLELMESYADRLRPIQRECRKFLLTHGFKSTP